MSVTPHGWHIPGSLKPEDYDESKLAYRCGGVNHCSECHLVFSEWLNDKVSRGAISINRARTLMGLKTFEKKEAPVIDLHLSLYDKENMARARLGLDPITSVTLHNWTAKDIPSSHYTLMPDGTIKDNTIGMHMTKHANSTSAVEHPAHYNQYPVEVIDLVEEMSFNGGNAVKYITRAPFKGKELEDLDKALYYIKKEIKRIKRKQKKEAKRQIRYVGPVTVDGQGFNQYRGEKA